MDSQLKQNILYMPMTILIVILARLWNDNFLYWLGNAMVVLHILALLCIYYKIYYYQKYEENKNDN